MTFSRPIKKGKAYYLRIPVNVKICLELEICYIYDILVDHDYYLI